MGSIPSSLRGLNFKLWQQMVFVAMFALASVIIPAPILMIIMTVGVLAGLGS
jgi:hypothetical protein